MKPKILTQDEWNLLLRKFKTLSYNNWSHLDGLKKQYNGNTKQIIQFWRIS